ncbi:putative lactoylglutathione lyase [alpha proteobacterium Q-1]|nr:putative lactoylglutathione lyase [alpha proteobacterium Q-1]
MIGYVTVGTKDLEKAAAFFDALLALKGGSRLMQTDRVIAWRGKNPQDCGFGIALPQDGNPASVGNGVMVAIEAASPQEVDAIYKKALELGGTDEGAPGERMPGFYAGYFRDLDGNKFNAFHMNMGG